MNDRAREDGEVEAEGPFVRLKVRGSDAIRIVLTVTIIGTLGFVIYAHDLHMDNMRAEIKTQLQRSQELMEELVYVDTLTQAEREKIKLRMPASLRSKMRREEE